ncbi:hypothetical protein [Micromonospora cathayae]|uniref:DivIVA domain-containing protein n=1 Tax=Micromonospora cathayae TaxID=3028804 RepID=A0ABY7ZIA1_9ACTN|nr:hypothetical protein [Micromonospora sp. HUAS 3]WDZ82501.1 hypothetical protein PVK37_18650 [Micromonospora sp. HUAS 3]
MRFSVVEMGYDQRQVDSCLDDLSARLAELAARAAGAGVLGDVGWEQFRDEVVRLRDLVDARRPDVVPVPVDTPTAAAAPPVTGRGAPPIATALPPTTAVPPIATSPPTTVTSPPTTAATSLPIATTLPMTAGGATGGVRGR